MSFALPNPSAPTDGDSLLGTPIRQNFQAISTALQALDGTALVAGSVSDAALATAINTRARFAETGMSFVYTGLNPSVPGGLTVTVPAGTAYVNGYRVASSGTTVVVAINNDTYVDMDQNGAFYSSAVANSATSPALTAGRIRLMIIVSGASAVTSINQGDVAAVAPVVASNTLTVCDSLGNLIYPTNPNGGLIGYRKITTNFATTANAATPVTGLSCPVITNGRRVKITAYTSSVFTSTGGGVTWTIWDGVASVGTQLQQGKFPASAVSSGPPLTVEIIASPAAGSKTYTVGQHNPSGGGNNSTSEAGTTNPSFIKVETV